MAKRHCLGFDADKWAKVVRLLSQLVLLADLIRKSI
jgi:hypothetical protein